MKFEVNNSLGDQNNSSLINQEENCSSWIRISYLFPLIYVTKNTIFLIFFQALSEAQTMLDRLKQESYGQSGCIYFSK